MQTPRCSLVEGPWTFATRLRRAVIFAAVAGLLCSTFAASVYGQSGKKKTDKDEEKIPPPEELLLPTGDGLQLSATYYPGLKGQQSIPIVLLHGWNQSWTEYKSLAPALQSLGHAVVVPDLRGHGRSTRIRKEGRKDETLIVAKMSPAQIGLMVTEDMKAVKNFLWERNNARELNLDKLCVVGAEMGASVALDFAWYDAVGYDSNRVFYGPLKLGRFVKALVLISPEWSFRGLTLRRAAAQPEVQSDISMLILVGKQDNKALANAKRIYDIFEKFHPVPTGDDRDDRIDKQTLFFGKLNTSLQGTKLLDPKFNVQGILADFIERRLIKSDESKTWTWKERKLPYE